MTRKTQDEYLKYLQGSERIHGMDFMDHMTAELYGVFEKYIPDMQKALDAAKKEGRAEEQTVLIDAVLRFVPAAMMMGLLGCLNNDEPSVRKAKAMADYSLAEASRFQPKSMKGNQEVPQTPPSSDKPPPLH